MSNNNTSKLYDIKIPCVIWCLGSFVCCFYCTLFREGLESWMGGGNPEDWVMRGGSWTKTDKLTVRQAGQGGRYQEEERFPYCWLRRGFGYWCASGGERPLAPAQPVVFQKGGITCQAFVEESQQQKKEEMAVWGNAEREFLAVLRLGVYSGAQAELGERTGKQIFLLGLA